MLRFYAVTEQENENNQCKSHRRNSSRLSKALLDGLPLSNGADLVTGEGPERGLGLIED